MSRSNTFNPGQRIELTPRQEDVVRLIAGGLTNSEIADRLGVTLDGVKWHVREILGKFGVESREQAAELWKQENTVGRRVRNWSAGLWAATGVRWAGGLAVAGSAGIVGVAAIVQSLDSRDEPEVLPAAEVVEVDPATNDGLTLKIDSVEADDVQTKLTFSLEGRPELGRISGIPQGIFADRATGRLTDQVPLQLRDGDGNVYRARSGGSVDGLSTPRTWVMTFDSVSSAARSLTLEMSGVPFVAPTFETQPGERPPDPSTVVDGPWVATVFEIPRNAVNRSQLEAKSLPVADGTFLPLEIVQTANGTLLRLRTAGIDPNKRLEFFPSLTLRDANGMQVPFANLGAGWGNKPDPEILEQGFEEVHGEVSLTIEAKVIRANEFGTTYYCLDADTAACPTDADRAERARLAEIRAEELEAIIASQPPATWTFVIP